MVKLGEKIFNKEEGNFYAICTYRAHQGQNR